MPCVLVIDDCRFTRKAVASMLEAGGWDVVCAADGREGEEVVQSWHVDVVITDIFMPTQDGIETIMRLRERRPSLKIIAMSGAGADGADGDAYRQIEPPYLRHAKLLGAHQVLTKPIQPPQLIAAVRACCPTTPAIDARRGAAGRATASPAT